MVGAVYWFVYLRATAEAARLSPPGANRSSVSNRPTIASPSADERRRPGAGPGTARSKNSRVERKASTTA